MTEIPQGDKTIKLSIHFFAGGLPNPKMAWQKGRVSVVTNRSRGLRNNDEAREMFNNLKELPDKILKVIEKNGVIIVNKNKNKELVMVYPRKMKKWFLHRNDTLYTKHYLHKTILTESFI